jgi:hypothetical protein
MAGSYTHIIEDDGNFVDNDTFVDMIENLGDAYEMAEEMYGMIWFLAQTQDSKLSPAERVGMARQQYKVGLERAKATIGKGKYTIYDSEN